MKLLFITAELFPFVKTGGLADYSEAMAKLLSKDEDIDFRLLVPGYPSIIKHLKNPKIILECSTLLTPSHNITLLEGRMSGFSKPVLVIKAPKLYEREGNPYVDSSGNDWPDNFERFATLGMLPYLMVAHSVPWIPEVIHANDWHTGLAPAYLQLLPNTDRPKCIFTIHNIAFQGNFPAHTFPKTGLPESLYQVSGVEFFEKFSFMKSGVNFSEKVITVSPRYAFEVASTDSFGCGFSGILASRDNDFLGILNGVDYSVWSPSKDKALKYHYDKTTLKNKKLQKLHFQNTIGLAKGKTTFLIASVSRLSHQKGLDMAIRVLQNIIPRFPSIQFVCIGTGDSVQEIQLAKLAKEYPQQVFFFNGYNEEFAHQAIGSADAFLMPSRFEPCGLTQIYALKYGTIPLVTPVGGLLDTIKPYLPRKTNCTGFISQNISEDAIKLMILNASDLYTKHKPIWNKLITNAMNENFSWKKSVASYKQVYKGLPDSSITI